MRNARFVKAALAFQLAVAVWIAPWAETGRAEAAGRFIDDDGSVHEAAIEAIAVAGITQGCDSSGTRFCPETVVTRGQIAELLVRALNLPAVTINAYPDDNDSIHENAINRVTAAGIANGCGSDRFCPLAPATRGEMAVFLSRAFRLGVGPDVFSDDAASPYQDHINRLANAQISNGCAPGRFCPDLYVTRGETASFLARALGLVAPVSVPMTAPVATSCQGVQVAAGSNLVTVANAHPAGTTFCLAAGNYAVAATIPAQTGDRWIGDNRRSILSGGDSTATSFKSDGVSNLYVAGFVIERFNTPLGGGLAALKLGPGSVADDNEIRNNATVGLYQNSRTVVRDNFIHHNGQYGIASFGASDALAEGNEVSFNNTRGFNNADQGGAKWTASTNLIVRNNYFHDNFHTGIWLDSNNKNTLIEGNRSDNNTSYGIHFEISCSAVIRGNSVSGNAQAGIFVNASQNTEVANNTVVGNRDGIRVWAQDRGDGDCNWIAQNVNVHHNHITMTTGHTGLQLNTGQGNDVFTSGSIRFTDNTYDVSDPGGRWFHWSGSLRTWTEWQGYGQDQAGAIS